MIVSEDIQITHASEQKADESGFGLGRLPAIDPRDRLHLMTAPRAATIDRRSRHWITGAALSQGDLPHCVAYSGEQFLISSPVRNKFYKTPRELYDECQRHDEWEGEGYDGTSVRALFRVLRSAGYIESWQNAFEIDVVARHLLTTSPVILGTNWDQAMFTPFTFGTDKATFIRRGGGVMGGHAYILVGINLDRKCPDGSVGAVRILNSWSAAWGDKGRAWMSLKDASSLISEFGEAITSRELKFTPVVP